MTKGNQTASYKQTFLDMAATGRRCTLNLTPDELQLLIQEISQSTVLHKGLALLERGRAIIYLGNAPNVWLMVKTKRRLTREQLQELGFVGNVYGSEVKDTQFLSWLWDEVKHYWPVSIALLLLTPYLVAIRLSPDSFIVLNQATLSVVAIFVAVHLAFMSLFYSSTRNRPHTYLDQTFADQAANDRYIVVVAVLSIWMSIVSILLGEMVPSAQPLVGAILTSLRNSCLNHTAWCSVLTRSSLLSIMLTFNFFLVYISLVAITDYYLSRARDERLSSAYKSLHKKHFPSVPSNNDEEI